MATTCTVWIIVQQDGQHLLEYDLMIRSILKVTENKNVRYIIYYYDQESKITTIKKITKKNEIMIVKTIETPHQADFYAVSTLKEFFKKYNASIEFYSDNNVVLFWGHGSGLGYFNGNDNNKSDVNYLDSPVFSLDNPEQLNVVNSLINYYVHLGSTLSIENNYLQNLISNPDKRSLIHNNQLLNILNRFLKDDDQKKYLFLSPKDINEILCEGFNDKPIDLLLTNSCYNQTIETIIHFRKSVKFIVAPQTSLPFLGYNFSSFFSELEKTGIITTSLLINNLVNNFIHKYKTEPYQTLLSEYYDAIIPEDYIEKVSFSVIDMHFYNKQFIDSINFLAACLNQFVGDSYLIDSRKHCKDLTGKNFSVAIDLTYFLEQFANTNRIPEFPKLLEDYKIFLTPNSLRVSFLQAAKFNQPNFLSVIMLEHKGVPYDIKEVVKDMLNIAYKNSPFIDEMGEWSKFMIAWSKDLL